MPPKKYFKESRLKIREKVKEKNGLTTADTLTKEQKKLVKKEVDAKMWKKIRARGRRAAEKYLRLKEKYHI